MLRCIIRWLHPHLFDRDLIVVDVNRLFDLKRKYEVSDRDVKGLCI